MLRPARFPDRENFLGGETLHRLFHDGSGDARANLGSRYAGSTKVGSVGSVTS